MKEIKEEDIDKLVDIICDLEEYLYNWACCRGNKLHCIDHRKWHELSLRLFQEYHFNLYNIQMDIINGKIILPIYIEKNPKLLALHPQLLEAHIKKVKEYEKKLNINIK